MLKAKFCPRFPYLYSKQPEQYPDGSWFLTYTAIEDCPNLLLYIQFPTEQEALSYMNSKEFPAYDMLQNFWETT